MDLLNKIDMLFEQEFTVYHEPVKSALLQTVGQVIRDVWDLDPRMSKFKNKSFQDVEREMSRTGAFKNLHDKAKAIQPMIKKAEGAKSANVEDLKRAGVSDKATAIIQTLDIKDMEYSKIVKTIQFIINAAIRIQVDNPKASDRDKTMLLKKIIQGIRGLDEHSICAIIFEIADADSQFSGFMQRASEQGAEKIAAAAAKKTGE
jgi:hypothetical protein